ncbi:hypothetical protein [Roseovarius nanhaiticus]|uniref:hypothetical protein n=1 Tax=Roseovarius nanhaiticus TaxID=573024 RepID=UPI002492DA56|nr:hypothetical protein [Roseovarius nanhaiticus]
MPVTDAEVRPRPGAQPIARVVEGRALLPCRLQEVRRFCKVGIPQATRKLPSVVIGQDEAGIREPFGEEETLQTLSGARCRTLRADGNVAGPNAMKDEARLHAGFLQPTNNVGTVRYIPFAHSHQEAFGHRFAQVRRLGAPLPLGLCTQLGAPSRQLYQLLTLGRAGIGPAEPGIEQILVGVPEGAACRTRWIGIMGAHQAIRAQDPPRH